MIFKEVKPDLWINMELVIHVEVRQVELSLEDTSGGVWIFPLNELKDTPEHWRNWLGERG